MSVLTVDRNEWGLLERNGIRWVGSSKDRGLCSEEREGLVVTLSRPTHRQPGRLRGDPTLEKLSSLEQTRQRRMTRSSHGPCIIHEFFTVTELTYLLESLDRVSE